MPNNNEYDSPITFQILEQEPIDTEISDVGEIPIVSSVNGKVGDVVLKTSDIENNSGYVISSDLDPFALIVESGYRLDLEMDSTTYVITPKLYNKNNQLITTGQSVDLPLETLVVSATYDATTKSIILTLKNGQTISVPVGDLVSGLATQEALHAHTSNADIHVTTGDKANWNAHYTKPQGGIPKADLTPSIRESLDKADSALQEHQSLTEYAKKQWVEDKGYLTEHQSLAPYRRALDQDLIDSQFAIKDELSRVAQTGEYQDLAHKPTIPTVNDRTVTITQNGEVISTFTLNSATDVSVEVPTASTIDHIKVDGDEVAIVNKTVNLTTLAKKQNLLDHETNTSNPHNVTKAQVGLNNVPNKNFQAEVDQNAEAIEDIQDLIPSQATYNNKLADKAFVNSSIATNTATFRGTFNSVAELEAYTGDKDNNDYAFVRGEDEWGNQYFARYKFVATTPTSGSWLYEYSLNNSSFTEAQWEAINSGITEGKIEIFEQYATTKQDTLESGTNIKTINGASILGSGDLIVRGEGAVSSVNGQDGDVVLDAEDVGALPDTTPIPDSLSDLSDDATHRLVTDTEKAAWNAKQNAISDLETIRSGASAGATAYQKPTNGILKTDLESAVQTSLTKADNAQPKETGKGLSTNDYDNTEKSNVASNTASRHTHSNKTVLDGISSTNITNWNSALQPSALTPYRTSADQDVIDNGKASVDSVSAIEEKIPSQASSTNQLADKEFVNSSIATETAHYISDDGEPFTSVSDLPTTGVTNNDYAFVTGTDADGNTFYDKYKASVVGTTVTWGKEYRLNNSSFTAAQWSAISSGISSALVSSYNTHIGNNDIHVTTTDKTNWNNKADNSTDTEITTAYETAMGREETNESV